MTDEDWRRRAACRVDPSLMWLEEKVLVAKQLCSVCPVLPECAEWEAASTEFVPGVIAGLDDAERAAAMGVCARCFKAKPARGSSHCRKCANKAGPWERAMTKANGTERKQCPQCHDWFQVGHGNAKFCCNSHRIHFYRERANNERRSRALV